MDSLVEEVLVICLCRLLYILHRREVEEVRRPV